jgi:anaerobic magnesium-protoporphyrin IX monomethyl ester cyclase
LYHYQVIYASEESSRTKVRNVFLLGSKGIHREGGDYIRLVLADPPLAHLRGESATESPNLGILHLISYIRKRLSGLNIEYLEPFLDFNSHIKRTIALNPEVYGISFSTVNKDVAYKIVNAIRTAVPQALIITGGAHPTADPEDVLNHCRADICVMGEGEETLLELLKGFECGNLVLSSVKGMAYRNENGIVQVNASRQLLDDIDFLPAWDLVDFGKYDTPVRKKRLFSYLLSSRGCPFSCVFCSNPVWKLSKPWVRLRKPESIANEAQYLYSRGVREIYLRSDTFNANKSWAISVCKAIRRLKLNDLLFQCNIRADNFDENLAQHLHSINCWLVHVGLESASERVLSGIKKDISPRDILDTCQILKKHGIETYGFFMLYNAWEENGSLCHETTLEVNKTLRFARGLLKSKLIKYMSWSLANPLRGSELYRVAIKHHILPSSGNPKLPIKFSDVSHKEMLFSFKKGVLLQLMNGIVNREVNFRSRKRILRKVRILLGGFLGSRALVGILRKRARLLENRYFS